MESKKQQEKHVLTTQDYGPTGSELATRDIMGIQTAMDLLPNPDPVLRTSGKASTTYRDMLVDGHLQSVTGKRIAAVSARPVQLLAMQADKNKSQWLSQIAESWGMRKIVRSLMDAVLYGYSVLEIVWKIDEYGMVVPEKIVGKPHEWFAFDKEGALGLLNRGVFSPLPGRKFLIARHRSDYANPYGLGVLSSCFWPLAFKKGGIKFWAILAEKYGIPKAVAKVPGGTPIAEQRKLLVKLEAMVRDAAAVIPDNSTVELLEAKSSGGGPHESLVAWADKEMSKAVLGETLTTDLPDNSGSRAAAEVHQAVRADLAMDDASMVEEALNTLARWIWELNWPGDKVMPQFQVQMPEDLNMGRLERDKGLAGIGAKFSKSYFMRTYGLSDQDLDADHAPGPSFAEARSCKCGQCGGMEFGEEAGFMDSLLQTVDAGVNSSVTKDLLKPILELADGSASFQEFETALETAFPNLSSERFESALNKLLLISEMKGRLDANHR